MEIQKVLDELPEYLLPDALNTLKELLANSNEKSMRSAHIKLILEEDKELLELLAQ